MYYVMSDIHGEYEKYLLMLELIHFSEKDFMFILGDVVDRGQKPVSVLLDMMSRPNVFPIMIWKQHLLPLHEMVLILYKPIIGEWMR